MPVMNGLELTKIIRKKYTKEQMSIFALSGTSDSHTSAMFLKRGANDYINKPFSKEELSCRLNNAIEALENIDTITNFANRDFLTGLYNRRYFFREMKKYFQYATEDHENFCTAMIDIDNFKRINDEYGHDVGDKVIVHLADILRSSVEAEDIVSRFGGEEFCIVLKDVGGNQAMEIFERIRKKISASSIPVENDKEIYFTVSIGLLAAPEDTLANTITEADAKLYQAKELGKNRVVI